MSCRICSIYVCNTAEANILSSTADFFGTDSIALLVITNNISRTAVHVLTQTILNRPADVNDNRFTLETWKNGSYNYIQRLTHCDLRAVQSLVELFKLVRKVSIKLYIMASVLLRILASAVLQT